MAESVWAQNTGVADGVDEQDRELEVATETGRVARWFSGEPEDMASLSGDELITQLFTK